MASMMLVGCEISPTTKTVVFGTAVRISSITCGTTRASWLEMSSKTAAGEASAKRRNASSLVLIGSVSEVSTVVARPVPFT
jgi:hypothetical protein